MSENKKYIDDEEYNQLESIYYELIDEIEQLKQRVSNHFKQTIKVKYTKTEFSKKNDAFVEHIQDHLEKDHLVGCKICGKDIETIWNEEKELDQELK